jgi:hypothetical protein
MASTDDQRPTHTSDYIAGDWDKSVFLGNAQVDNLMTALLGLGGEYWAMRRRLMVVEKLLETRCGIAAEEIEAYVPDAAETASWNRRRDEFIERVFGVLVRATADVSGPIDAQTLERRPPRVPGLGSDGR